MCPKSTTCGWIRIWELCATPKRSTQIGMRRMPRTPSRFELDPNTRSSTSPRDSGRADLLVALAHRPEMLVLDEPSAGLDPIVRGDISKRLSGPSPTRGEPSSFSSHLLHEVEARVSDHEPMIDKGRIVFSAPLDDIKLTHRCLTLCFAEVADPAARTCRRTRGREGMGHESTVLYHGSARRHSGWRLRTAG